MNADQFAFHGLDRLGASIGCGFNSRDVADYDGGAEGVANLGHGTREFDIGSL
jgi:hypothetical protein